MSQLQNTLLPASLSPFFVGMTASNIQSHVILPFETHNFQIKRLE